MTFFEYLKRLSEILAPECSDELYNYILHSMDDDGGFLRTRWCYWDKTLREWKGDFSDIHTALVAVKGEGNFYDPGAYYGDDFGGEKTTELKMQIFYFDCTEEDTFDSNAEWSAQLGYCKALKIDMEHGTVEEKEYSSY